MSFNVKYCIHCNGWVTRWRHQREKTKVAPNIRCHHTCSFWNQLLPIFAAYLGYDKKSQLAQYHSFSSFISSGWSFSASHVLVDRLLMIGAWQPSGLNYRSLLSAAYPKWVGSDHNEADQDHWAWALLCHSDQPMRSNHNSFSNRADQVRIQQSPNGFISLHLDKRFT